MINILYLHAGAELYGADVVLLELLKGLDKKIIKPYVILPCKGPLVDKLKENNIEVLVISYPIIRRKYFNPIGLFSFFRSLIKNLEILKRYCVDKKIDIVHSNTSAVIEGIFLKNKLDIKHIWHIHEILVSPKIMYKLLSYLISKFSDRVITVSEATKNHLSQSGYFNNKSIEVIYNGVDNKKFNPNNECEYLRNEFNLNEADIVVGMIGRVNAWKGQKDFIQALEKVMGECKNVKAVLVGGVFEGQEWRMRDLKQLIAGSKYKSNFVISDFRQDTSNIYCLYDLFVLPSTNPDPLPTVVLEAMACGKPVVGYRHGGIKEMVKEEFNGLLAEPCNIDDLADKIRMLVDNTRLKEEFGANSLTRQKKHFSLTSYISNFTKIYVDLIKRK